MLRYLPIGVVVIDNTYRILTVNESARRILGIRELGSEQDFLHAVRGLPYARVRDAIDTAFRERSTVTVQELELDPSIGGDGRYCTLSVAVMHIEPASQELAIVTVSDGTDLVQSRRRLEAMESEHAQLVGELSSANKRLVDMNRELLDANEELQSANEELMLTQEEMQATNEEFEATNEELQATNEELETNNEELQATNEELQTTNDELSARTNELQEVTKAVSTERRRLSEIIRHTPQSILVLSGPSLSVEAYNDKLGVPMVGREIVGHPFEDVFEGSDLSALIDKIRETYRKDIIQTTLRLRAHIPDAQGETVVHDFIHTIVPLHDDNGKVDGIVVYSQTAQNEEK
jgi:two-component system CheB/CheR fusion protein